MPANGGRDGDMTIRTLLKKRYTSEKNSEEETTLNIFLVQKQETFAYLIIILIWTSWREVREREKKRNSNKERDAYWGILREREEGRETDRDTERHNSEAKEKDSE